MEMDIINFLRFVGKAVIAGGVLLFSHFDTKFFGIFFYFGRFYG